MLHVDRFGDNVVDHLGDLIVFVVTLDNEAGKREKGDCDERLNENTRIHLDPVLMYTADMVLERQTVRHSGQFSALQGITCLGK